MALKISEMKTAEQKTAEQIRRDIIEEIFRAIKFPDIKFLRRLLSPLFSIPARRFSEFVTRIDALIAEKGFSFAAQRAVDELTLGAVSDGNRHIPVSGSLIVASNHPGTYDAFALVSKIPRDDVHLIVSGIPFFRNLPNAGKRMLYASGDIGERAEVVRKSITHLKCGGALLIYPSGKLDPDVSVRPDAENAFGKWSRSIEVFLRKVPDAKVVLAFVSGVVDRKYAFHTLSRLLGNDHEQRRLAEFIQLIQQMIRGKQLPLTPRISFSESMKGNVLLALENGTIMDEITNKAGDLHNFHLEKYYGHQNLTERQI